jgi:CRISPR/Cas system-associated protein Csm6
MGEMELSNTAEFANAHTLAKEIERLTKERDALAKEREDAQTKLLESHSEALDVMKKTLLTVEIQTRCVAELGKRVAQLERWKAFVAGVAAAFTMIGGTVGFIIGLVTRH